MTSKFKCRTRRWISMPDRRRGIVQIGQCKCTLYNGTRARCMDTDENDCVDEYWNARLNYVPWPITLHPQKLSPISPSHKNLKLSTSLLNIHNEVIYLPGTNSTLVINSPSSTLRFRSARAIRCSSPLNCLGFSFLVVHPVPHGFGRSRGVPNPA